MSAISAAERLPRCLGGSQARIGTRNINSSLFYEPKEMDDHISILGFNYALLSNLLIQAIIDHQELVPGEALVRRTQEQDLVLEKTLGELRRTDAKNNP